MSEPCIIDAHLHLGPPGVFFAPETESAQLLARMDRLRIRCAVCTDDVTLFDVNDDCLIRPRQVFEQSGGRIHYLGVFDPRRPEASLRSLGGAKEWPGFVGIKIHPSMHGVPAEDERYEPAWRFAAESDLPILTHSWSASGYNPEQHLSTPERFERHVRKYPGVRFVLGHAGGRGTGRHEAVRMANEYPNVYVDFAGDIFCYRLIETLVASVPTEKILFGSDFPWLDPSANLTRVLLADVPVSAKRSILCENALHVYRIGAATC